MIGSMVDQSDGRRVSGFLISVLHLRRTLNSGLERFYDIVFLD